jgi:DNA-directed RNA polymerase specialized sigma24 family protein
VTRDWVATPGDLSTLVSWLDGSEGAGGESYVAMHGRLASYFARKGCRTPEDLADDTLTRVARRLREEGAITGVLPAQYCYIVARFVFLEHLRSPEHDGVGLVGDVPARPGGEPGGEDDGRDRLLASLDACLEQLDARDRTLILEYYSGGRADRIAMRRELAAKLRLSPNAMSIRACRLRERLRTCLSRSTAPRSLP